MYNPLIPQIPVQTAIIKHKITDTIFPMKHLKQILLLLLLACVAQVQAQTPPATAPVQSKSPEIDPSQYGFDLMKHYNLPAGIKYSYGSSGCVIKVDQVKFTETDVLMNASASFTFLSFDKASSLCL